MMWTLEVLGIDIGFFRPPNDPPGQRGEPWCFLNPLRVQQRKVCRAALLGCRQGHRALGAWRPDALDALCIGIFNSVLI